MDERHLKVEYTNYRGETTIREVIPQRIYFGNTPWHPELQWLLLVHDVGKDTTRSYALKDCNFNFKKENG